MPHALHPCALLQGRQGHRRRWHIHRGCVASSCGIDLGTTNSCVAVIEGGKPVIVPLPNGRRTLPSVVAYTREGDVLVGEDAIAHSLVDPLSTFSSVKRFMGRKFSDVTQEAARVQFKVVADDDDQAALLCPARSNAVLRPEEVSSEVLRPLVQAASQAMGVPITRAVVTVPAYFNNAQRQATLRAARLAGLERVKLVREPVAAALAYGLGKSGDATVLVFDLGGGTLDVSLLDVGGPTVEVLATSGDTRLGGDDFDDVLATWMAAQMTGSSSSTAPAAGAVQSPPPRGALRAAARTLREALTSRESVNAKLDATTTVRLTRSQFDSLAASLLERMWRPVEEASWTAGVDLSAERASEAASRAAADSHVAADGSSKGGGKRARKAAAQAAAEVAVSASKQRRRVNTVVLVGGATRMPCVQRLVSTMVAQPVVLGAVDPDEAVALGAAIHAGSLDGTVTDVEALETWQATLMRALLRNQAKQAARREREEALAEELQQEVLTRAVHSRPVEAPLDAQYAERLPTADEQDLCTSTSMAGSSTLAMALARAHRPGHTVADAAFIAGDDDTELDHLDIEDILSLGLTSDIVDDDELITFETEDELRRVLGAEAFLRLAPVPTRDSQKP